MNNSKSRKSVLQVYEPGSIHDNVIGKIASSYFYVHCDTMIHDLADALIKNASISAVGIVDDDNKALGVIPRKDLFSILGKPFGRDLNKNRTVMSLLGFARMYHYRKNIFAVAEDLSSYLRNLKTVYFLLTDEDDRFAGIFSSRDLLIFLSDITQRDIQLAKQLQSCIVAEEQVIDSDGLIILGASKMARGLGGDFYYIKRYAEHKWIICLCDVSGKGVSAALMSVTMGGMKSIYNFAGGLRDYIEKLNRYIFMTFGGQLFVTGMFLDLDERTGKGVLYNFGHSYFFIHRGKRLRELKSQTGNFPIGIQNDIKPMGIGLQLYAGDLIIMMTDGFEEQINAQGERYGAKRVLRMLNENIGHGVKEIKDSLYRDVQQFRKNQTQHDDMSLLLLQYKGQG